MYPNSAGRLGAALRLSPDWFVMGFRSQQKYQPLDLLRKGWMNLFTAEYFFPHWVFITLGSERRKRRPNAFLSGGFYMGIVLRWLSQKQQVSNWKKILTTHMVWQSAWLGPREGQCHLPEKTRWWQNWRCNKTQRFLTLDQQFSYHSPPVLRDNSNSELGHQDVSAVKVLATKTGTLSFIPGIHGRREEQTPSVLLCPLHR